MTNPQRHNVVEELLRDSKVQRIVEEAIIEDLGLGDITTESVVSSEAVGQGDVIVKEPGVIAGLGIASLVFKVVDSELAFDVLRDDGAEAEKGAIVAVARGRLTSILKAERTALNFLQRMSGIATLTKKFVGAVEGTHARITDTRKTAPGLRILDKLAVRCGGGVNHRFGLDDMVLIKDNHVAIAGGVSKAIEQCVRYLENHNINVRIEVETRTVDEVREALRHEHIHRIMLDNFSLDEIRKAVQIIDRRVEVEVSGNVSLENVRPIAEAGVDFISVGRLTHSPKALDISVEVSPTL